jgi:hypothetical protein
MHEAEAGGSWLGQCKVMLGVAEVGLEIQPSLLGGWFCVPGSDVRDKTAGSLEYDLPDVDELLAGGWGLGSVRH